jgi:poly(3-hydroxybutyrate) depolymerase
MNAFAPIKCRAGRSSAMGAIRLSLCCAAIVAGLAAIPARPAYADEANGFGSRFKAFREMMANKRENDALKVSEEDLGAHSQNVVQDSYGGRDMILYVPSRLPPPGQRGMVVALHGGGGNAEYIKDHLKMDGVAEKYGFIVAYLNGSDASARLPGKMKAWNAGNGCCGEPYKNKVDDVGYITAAVHYLAGKYGVNPKRIYGIGHSNGAMMTETLTCETGLYQSAISLAGSLMAEVDSCAGARGKTILAIHGMDDANVPPGGGNGTRGVTNIAFKSEAGSRSMFESSGGKYIIEMLPGTDHSLEHIGATVQKTEGISLAEKAARFFGLAPER